MTKRCVINGVSLRANLFVFTCDSAMTVIHRQLNLHLPEPTLCSIQHSTEAKTIARCEYAGDVFPLITQSQNMSQRTDVMGEAAM
jgi:hypothetical protein